MIKLWLDPEKINPPPALQTYVDGHPLVSQTLAQRGITKVEEARAFLNPEHYTPAPPTDLPDLAKAAGRIEQAIQRGETILVWGDFDVDGQTSTTLLVEALRDLGAQVTYHIPVRATEGHGINLEKLQEHLLSTPNSQRPTVLLTCDTGISEHKAVEYAQSHGVDVLITDHHELDKSLPNAYAVVNPHRSPDVHPLSTLPGVGVAYKLVEQLIDGKPQSPVSGIPSEKYLDLVALGIVADVAEQTGDTRYLLQRGLQVLRNTQRLGLKTLYEIAEIIPSQLDEGHIGFSIGPRLNALGRLSDANSIVEFFTTTDPGRARILALQLDGLNERRKLLTNQVYQGALAQIERDPKLLDYAALVLAHPGWPNGIVGIVASRLVEKFGLPTILFNAPEGDASEDGLARGSARSVDGVNITEAIAAQADLLAGFGGHAGAAGMALPVENIPEFRVNLSRTIRGALPPEGLQPTLRIDSYLPLSEVSLELVDDLERLAPFGAGNPPLVLATRDLKLVSAAKIGRSGEHFRLVVEDPSGFAQSVLWWRGVGEVLPDENIRFDLAFRASANTFRGERRLQLEWIDFRVTEGQVIEVQPATPGIEIVDYRHEPHPLPLLTALRAQSDVQVWAEGEDKTKVNGVDRFQLVGGDVLAIWTTPSGYWELQSVMERVSPKTVYLFAHNPGLDQPQVFLARLAGLVKFVIAKKNGQTTLAELSAATAQLQGTVQMGLFWLSAKGYIRGELAAMGGEWGEESGGTEPGMIRLLPGTGEESTNLDEITTELKSMLDETDAYRKHFLRADKDSLFAH